MQHPAPAEMKAAVHKAFLRKLTNCSRKDRLPDAEGVVRAGLVAMGYSRAKAYTLFNFVDQRVSRRAKKKSIH
jgi:hypothetical protein